jgi:hypothetical protein
MKWNLRSESLKGLAMGWVTSVIVLAGVGILLLATMFRLALGPTQPHTHLVLRVKWLEYEADC